MVSVRVNTLKLKAILVGLTLASGCAHVPSNSGDLELKEESPKTLADVLSRDRSQGAGGPVRLPKPSMMDYGEVVVNGIKLKNTKFDYPIVVNSRVESWIDYFTGRGRKHFEKYLFRSKFFIPYIAPLLKQNGMPEDLVYLAMIESGFNNLARSRAKAVGPWQFISATGKRYGLMVNWWVDERRDIRKSTLSAVEYLRDLYGMFQSWELAAAAYNAGEAKVARAIRRFGTKDFWVLSQHRFLKPETRDYVPKIMAAAIIAKNRGQFGFPELEAKPAADEVVAGDGEIVKVIKTDQPLEDKDYQAEKDEDSENLMELAGNEDEDAVKTEGTSLPLAKPVPTPHMTRDGRVGGEELAEFDVQGPADLLKVARAAGLSYHTVKSLNPEILRWCTPPSVGAYRIRLPISTKERFLATYNHETFPRKVQFMTYKVNRRGDTLSRIARHFGIKVDPIRDLNRVSPMTPLRNGLRVLLPIPNDRSRTLTSLEVLDPPERRTRHRRGRRYYKVTYKHRESARSVGTRNNQRRS